MRKTIRYILLFLIVFTCFVSCTFKTGNAVILPEGYDEEYLAEAPYINTDAFHLDYHSIFSDYNNAFGIAYDLFKTMYDGIGSNIASLDIPVDPDPQGRQEYVIDDTLTIVLESNNDRVAISGIFTGFDNSPLQVWGYACISSSLGNSNEIPVEMDFVLNREGDVFRARSENLYFSRDMERSFLYGNLSINNYSTFNIYVDTTGITNPSNVIFIDFPDSFIGQWLADDGTTAEITDIGYQIFPIGSDPISNIDEYSGFDWLDIYTSNDLVTIVPMNANGYAGDRIDVFKISEDGTLIIGIGDAQYVFGPFTRQ